MRRLMISVLVSTSVVAMSPMVLAEEVASQAEQAVVSALDCHDLAVQQTGINPDHLHAPQKPSDERDGERLRGAAIGAGAGAVIGGIANDDAGDGAGVGAAVGVVAGGSKARRNDRQEEEDYERARDDYQRKLNTFDSAYQGCLREHNLN